MNTLVSKLVKNIFFTGTAFLIVGLVGLLLVPAIIHAYGLAAYGTIILARTFLPSGLLGLFDCGVTEIATKTSAQLRAGRADNGMAPVVLLGLSTGIILAIGIGLLSFYLPGLLIKEAGRTDLIEDFQNLLLISAGTLLVLFPGLVFEGIVRGRENFLLIRAVEVATTLFYAASTLLGIYLNQPYTWVAYAFLLGAVIKALTFAIWVARKNVLSWAEFTQTSLYDVWQVALRGSVFSQSKVLGTLLGQLPVMLTGFIFGPAGAAVYDVLTRLPRFMKSVIALANSVLFPTAARLDAGKDSTLFIKLIESGLPVVMLCSYSILAAITLLSKDIMTLWIGKNLVEYWHWLALMFISLVPNVVLGYLLAIASVRESVQRRYNKFQVVQLCIQFSLSFIFLERFQERAFILGSAAGVLILFPIQVQSVLKELGIKGLSLKSNMVRHLILFLMLAALHFSIPQLQITNIMELALAVAFWMFCYLIPAYWITVDKRSRDHIKRLLTVIR